MLLGDKLSWEDCISKHLPDFDPVEDPDIRIKATMVDACQHSTGLANPNAILIGPSGTTAIKNEDHLSLVNALPTTNEFGQRFNKWWYYSNAAFGLLAGIIAKSSETSFSSFLESDVRSNRNVAHPYVKRENGNWSRINNNCTTDTCEAVLASMGMRSSANDMLAFLAGVMSRYDEENNVQSPMKLLPQSEENPLGNISSMRNWWWGRPCDDGYEGIIGKESASRAIYGHSGCRSGSVATAYRIPESHSAVVALSNAADAGDAAETASQILLQALFDLKPAVDLLPSLKASVLERRQMHDSMIKDWMDHGNANLYTTSSDELWGTYIGLGVFRIDIVPSETAQAGLAVVFSDIEATRCDLEPYNADSLSFLPMEHHDKLQRPMIDWDNWTVGILSFVHEEEQGSKNSVGDKAHCWA